MSDACSTAPYTIHHGDIIRSVFTISANGKNFRAIRTADRVDLYDNPNFGLIGHITLGGPLSGAIWFGNDCIGEYLLNENGEYSISQIQQHRRVPAADVRCKDPLEYLLERAA